LVVVVAGPVDGEAPPTGRAAVAQPVLAAARRRPGRRPRGRVRRGSAPAPWRVAAGAAGRGRSAGRRGWSWSTREGWASAPHLLRVAGQAPGRGVPAGRWASMRRHRSANGEVWARARSSNAARLASDSTITNAGRREITSLRRRDRVAEVRRFLSRRDWPPYTVVIRWRAGGRRGVSRRGRPRSFTEVAQLFDFSNNRSTSSDNAAASGGLSTPDRRPPTSRWFAPVAETPSASDHRWA
jgi:hypothetical protein